MTNKRAELIQKNKNFIQIPMPNLSEMTDEELERRATLLEMAFESDDEDSEDL